MGSQITTKSTETNLPPLASGIPPWPSILFVAMMFPIGMSFLPSLEELDGISQVSVWTNRKFPNLISLQTMAYIRLSIAAIAIGLMIHLAVGPGWQLFPNYKPNSKLRRVFLRLQGFGTLVPFTSWSWYLLAYGFLCRGVIALAAAQMLQPETPPGWAINILNSPWLLRSTLITWELSAPFAMLVSTVTKYVLWPQAIKGGKPHNLAGFRNQLQHNCNAIWILLEATLLGGPPVKFLHISMAFATGAVYMLFTWIMGVVYFGNRKIGPQYIYWFMDTTLGKATTIAIVALTTALSIYFALFSFVMSTLLGGGGDSEPNLLLNVAVLVLGTHLVCRFKE